MILRTEVTEGLTPCLVLRCTVFIAKQALPNDEDVEQTNGINQARLGAQMPALGFDEKLRLRPIGQVYPDAGIDHTDMVRPLQ